MNNLKEGTFPLVSIVTVTYNAIDTIEQTILSVINQDYPNLEYIIVDGGSSDGTVEIIKKYESSLAKWISEPDKGLYDAMNKGLKLISGEWVSFKNSGDFFAEKDSLSKLFKNPIPHNISFVHADSYRVTDWGWIIEKPVDLSLYKDGIMPVIHPATFVRSEYHKKHPFDTKYRISADYNLICNALKAGCEFLYIPVPIVIFPRGGLSTIKWDLAFWESLSVAGKLETKSQVVKAHIQFACLCLKNYIKKILKSIPSIKRYLDKKHRACYNEMPLPLKKFY